MDSKLILELFMSQIWHRLFVLGEQLRLGLNSASSVRSQSTTISPLSVNSQPQFLLVPPISALPSMASPFPLSLLILKLFRASISRLNPLLHSLQSEVLTSTASRPRAPSHSLCPEMWPSPLLLGARFPVQSVALPTPSQLMLGFEFLLFIFKVPQEI